MFSYKELIMGKIESLHRLRDKCCHDVDDLEEVLWRIRRGTNAAMRAKQELIRSNLRHGGYVKPLPVPLPIRHAQSVFLCI